jgi:hypothetical protein
MKRGFILSFGIFVIVWSLFAMGKREVSRTAKPLSVEQGVAGKVEVWEGNFMPMIGGTPSGKKIPAADRRVRVHEPFNSVEAGGAIAVRDTIPTPLVAETRTDSAGQYFIPLEVGTYSVFVEENGGWYSNIWDGQGFQGVVVIDSNKVAKMDIPITRKAVF